MENLDRFIKKCFLVSLLTAIVACSHEQAVAKCTPEADSKVREITGKGVLVFDFSNSSVACLEDFARDVSGTDLTLVAESNSGAWREATVKAANNLQAEGAQVVVAYANDMDGSNLTAETVAWANGVKRGFVPVRAKNGLTIDQSYAPKVINLIQSKGEQVWDEYLKLPDDLDRDISK